MMNDTEKKRDALLRAYPNKKWRERVIRMSEDQVIAIYLRLKSQGKV